MTVIALEMSHVTVITSRRLAVAVKARQVLVELSVLRRHGEGCGIANVVSYVVPGGDGVLG